MITTDNVRKFKRLLQGRGVNIRETIVTAGSFSSVTPITVPGFLPGDELISVLNMTALTDIGGNVVLAVAASREFGSVNSRITFTAQKAGAQGNKIRVAYVNDQVQAVAGVAQPIKVTVVNTLSAGVLYTDIIVHLALGTDGLVDTTASSGPNSANAVRAAVLTQFDAPGHPRAADVVDVTIANGSGVTYVGTMVATVLQNGADSSIHGATPDTLHDTTNDLTWTERNPGGGARVIDIVYVQQTGLSVAPYITVTISASNHVTITVYLGTDGAGAGNTTAGAIVQLVEDSYRRRTSNAGDDGVAGKPLGAADFVSVAVVYPDSSATIAVAQSAAPLTGGSDDGGFNVNVDAGSAKVKVAWVTARG